MIPETQSGVVIERKRRLVLTLPYWAALEGIGESENPGAKAMINACPWCQRNFNDAIKETG